MKVVDVNRTCKVTKVIVLIWSTLLHFKFRVIEESPKFWLPNAYGNYLNALKFPLS